MNLDIITTNNQQLAVADTNEIIIKNIEDGTDLLGNVFYQGIDKVIINKQCIAPAFFDLKTGIAGEVLQKFATYRVRLVIFGDWHAYNSNSLRDFIYESNKGKHVNFLATKEKAIEILSQ